MRSKRVISAIAAAVLPAVLLVTNAGSASAACREVGQVSYKFDQVSRSSKATSLRSDWIETRYASGSISRTVSTTASVNASMTATVSAEGSVIFAKASASLGVTVGGSWAKTQAWTYSMNVPKGYRARVIMWHEMRTFRVIKQQINGKDCQPKTVWASSISAPILTDTANVYKLDAHKL